MTDKTPASAPKVVVEWRDIAEYTEWGEEEQDRATTVDAVTIGWLLEETETYILIASSYNYSDSRWDGRHVFPKLPPEVIYLDKPKEEQDGSDSSTPADEGDDGPD